MVLDPKAGGLLDDVMIILYLGPKLQKQQDPTKIMSGSPLVVRLGARIRNLMFMRSLGFRVPVIRTAAKNPLAQMGPPESRNSRPSSSETGDLGEAAKRSPLIGEAYCVKQAFCDD